ncbi:NUDIX hydrolase [Corynebacterium poyangense]|uniref:NUDIX hydrolase n=1 Tax=Corynebacterium poyangense TaxID=2684405 RepID=A0A7H0SL13_9CORY|nr:NUDIX domain-containing protein [Corynebacterium poyangense]MBZ8177324.1 NUDIX hydrolase [Corynebacterium poyangense]QNQ89238.1 NUDIX hydrolase [Corynebacterium poyangense]
MTDVKNAKSPLGPQYPMRDPAGTAKFRHQAIAVILKTDIEEGLQVLLHRRLHEPFSGRWELPSGSVEVNENLDHSVRRHLSRYIDPHVISHQEQLGTYSDVHRDPYDRTIATSYLILVPWNVGEINRGEGQWQTVSHAGDLAFDHQRILGDGIDRLRAKLSYSNISFALAPHSFSIAQLREAYRTVLGYDVAATNLQRVLARRGQLEETGELAKPPGGGRPAKLYRFTSQQLRITDPFAAFKP